MASLPLASEPEPRERIKLTDFESSATLGSQRGITTATFLSGRAGPASAFVRDRLRTIVGVNPWLAGRLVKDPTEVNLRLDYPAETDESGGFLIDDATLDTLVRLDPPGLEIHSGITYTELRNALTKSKAQLHIASTLVNKEDMVLRITIVSDSVDSEEKFAMIVSMSHTIGDGYTYYSIMSMLSEGGTISALNPKRQPDIEKLFLEATKEEISYIASLANKLCFCWNAFFRAKPECCAYYVDPARVEVSKAAAKSRGAAFVSTNDILVSTFSGISKSRICFMAMNLRNRFEWATDTDAGNYECLLGIDSGVYQHPEGIREVLDGGAPYVGRTRPFPGMLEAVGSTISVTSNWAQFCSDVVLPGCKHVLQIPITNFIFEAAVIFAPKANELAVLYGFRSMNHKLLREVAPLGLSVSETLFEDQ